MVRISNKLSLLLLIYLVSLSCGRRLSNRCGIGGKLLCTVEQQDFIDDIKQIANLIRKRASAFDDPGQQKIYRNQGHIASASLVMLGELHTSWEMIAQNFAIIEREMREGDAVLLEGAEYNPEAWEFGLHQKLLVKLKVIKDNPKTPYESRWYMRERNKLHKMWSQTHHAIGDLELKTQKIPVNYWDNRHCEGRLSERNKAMVRSMKRSFRLRYSRIFVMAGLKHLPVGEVQWMCSQDQGGGESDGGAPIKYALYEFCRSQKSDFSVLATCMKEETLLDETHPIYNELPAGRREAYRLNTREVFDYLNTQSAVMVTYELSDE